jgi:flagellar biosynthesis protein FlhF
LTIGNENDIVDRGGVYALVGPTGVGKTTTTAKLAARCVLRHGPSKVAW